MFSKKLIYLIISLSIIIFNHKIESKTILITGSNRGIGLEFVNQYAQNGWNVIATSRTPSDDMELIKLSEKYKNISIYGLDVTNHKQIDLLAKELKDIPIDILLNNAGILGGNENLQKIGNLDFESMENVYKTNAIGPLKVAEAFLENVITSNEKKIIVITSGTASIGNVKKSKYYKPLYLYRMSKTAINMGYKNLAIELAPQGVHVGIMAPGIVETRLLQQAGYSGMGMTTKESVKNVIRNIENLDSETSGKYILFNGKILPW
ncbi:MAG: SDR family oxidoreductase [Pseudomonadota bacterium]|nr:SDR family oxidoreductase [Pseudomonadota bacterium]